MTLVNETEKKERVTRNQAFYEHIFLSHFRSLSLVPELVPLPPDLHQIGLSLSQLLLLLVSLLLSLPAAQLARFQVFSHSLELRFLDLNVNSLFVTYIISIICVVTSIGI